jgi:hypothetical protein
MQPSPAKPVRPVSRQDVDRVTRLYETGDAAQLVLNFGQYRGATLLQVAAMDPDYIRQLALTAQRPEVRAAARQLVITLERLDSLRVTVGPSTNRIGFRVISSHHTACSSARLGTRRALTTVLGPLTPVLKPPSKPSFLFGSNS